MKTYFSGEKIEYQSPAIALGNFDGMHMGHIKVIEAAKNRGGSFGALLFKTHTSSDKVITPLSEKLRILEALGADFAYVVSFDEEFKNKSCAEFVVFLSSIGVKYVSVGYDYRCGKDAAADCTELAAELDKYGIDAMIADPVEVLGEPVKSSRIREYIQAGDITSANRLMTRPYRICGRVVEGLQNGRKLGFPTANIEIPKEQLLPKDGVYCCESIMGGKRYDAVMNIGKNPTFFASRRTVEVHIIDYDRDIYGESLCVDVSERIRGDMRFDSLEELSQRIELDKEYVISRRKKQ